MNDNFTPESGSDRAEGFSRPQGSGQGYPGGFEPTSSPYGSFPQSAPLADDTRSFARPEQPAPMGPANGSAPVGTAEGKRSVGLGTALGLMLAGAVAAGSIVGVAVGRDGDGDDSSTQSASEVLRSEPADAPPIPEGSVASVAEAVLPAVVSIQVVTNTSAGEGSGSIISPDGLVLTNHHVVAGATDGTVQVTLNDGTMKDADVVASDPATDIGIIKIRDASNLPTLEFGDSDQLVVGQEVVAVGAPLGLSGTVTSGIVSALERPVRASQDGGESSLIDAIQTDAAINPGNSGGPLVDMNGNLIGMNSVIASLSSGDAAGNIGLGFSIPSNFARRVADQLTATGTATQPMLGVTVDARNPVQGAQVVSVQPGGPGEQAGVRDGDIITRVNDRTIDTSDALIAAVRSHDFNETVTLEVLDPATGETREVEATLTGE